MAARSFCVSALVLICVAALAQVSSASCLRKPKCPYAHEAYESDCPCSRRVEEKKEFDVYSGFPDDPYSPCKAHYYNVEAPPTPDEEPCTALGYGMQVPEPKKDYLRCSTHSYQVQAPPQPKPVPCNAYGYLVSAPPPPPPPKCLSVGYQVDTPNQPIPEKPNAYGIAVAVPKRKYQPCVSRAFNYQVESPPTVKEEKYAYGIAVQKFPKPPPCIPCPDEYIPPECPPPPPPAPCVPCEDNYVLPKPKISFSFDERYRPSSDCPCEDEEKSSYESDDSNSGYYGSGSDCCSRYGQDYEDHKTYEVSHSQIGGDDASYDNVTPIRGGYNFQYGSVSSEVGSGESGEQGYQDGSSYGVDSAEDSYGVASDFQGSESYTSGEVDDQIESPPEYYDPYQTSRYHANPLYPIFASKFTHSRQDYSKCNLLKGAADSDYQASSYQDGYNAGYSTDNAQDYSGEVTYGDNTEVENAYDRGTVSILSSSTLRSSGDSYDEPCCKDKGKRASDSYGYDSAEVRDAYEKGSVQILSSSPSSSSEESYDPDYSSHQRSMASDYYGYESNNGDAYETGSVKILDSSPAISSDDGYDSTDYSSQGSLGSDYYGYESNKEGDDYETGSVQVLNSSPAISSDEGYASTYYNKQGSVGSDYYGYESNNGDAYETGSVKILDSSPAISSDDGYDSTYYNSQGSLGSDYYGYESNNGDAYETGSVQVLDSSPTISSNEGYDSTYYHNQGSVGSDYYGYESTKEGDDYETGSVQIMNSSPAISSDDGYDSTYYNSQGSVGSDYYGYESNNGDAYETGSVKILDSSPAISSDDGYDSTYYSSQGSLGSDYYGYESNKEGDDYETGSVQVLNSSPAISSDEGYASTYYNKQGSVGSDYYGYESAKEGDVYVEDAVQELDASPRVSSDEDYNSAYYNNQGDMKSDYYSYSPVQVSSSSYQDSDDASDYGYGDYMGSMSYVNKYSNSPRLFPFSYKNRNYVSDVVGDYKGTGEDSYIVKDSYSPVQYTSDVSYGKYDGIESEEDPSSNAHVSKYTYSNGLPTNYYHRQSHEPTYKHYTSSPLQEYWPQNEYRSNAGGHVYGEVQKSGHFHEVFSSGGSQYEVNNYAAVLDNDFIKLAGGIEQKEYKEDKTTYEVVEESGFHKLKSAECQDGGDSVVEKEIITVTDYPEVEEKEQVTVEKVKTIKVNSKEIIREEITDYTPEEETEVVVKVIGSGEKTEGENDGEHAEDSGTQKTVVVEKTITTVTKTSGGFGSSEVHVQKYSDRTTDDEDSYDEKETAHIIVNEDGSYESGDTIDEIGAEAVANEEAAVVDEYADNADKILVVEEEEGQKADVIVEGDPDVVLEKEVLVREDDGYGGERVVSKEIIKTIRPAVAVEVRVSDPAHEGRKSEHSSKEVTKIVKEVVIPREHDHSKVRVTKLEKILTEGDSGEAVYNLPNYGSAEKYEKVVRVNKGNSGEYHRKRIGSHERTHSSDQKTVVVTKKTITEYETPENEDEKYTTSTEYVEEKYATDDSEYRVPDHKPKKTVVITKKTSREYEAPEYEREVEEEGSEVISPHKTVVVTKETEYDIPKYGSMGDIRDEDTNVEEIVEKKYVTEGVEGYSHETNPQTTVVITKKTISDRDEGKHRHPQEYVEEVVVEEPKHTHILRPGGHVVKDDPTEEYFVEKITKSYDPEVRRNVVIETKSSDPREKTYVEYSHRQNDDDGTYTATKEEIYGSKNVGYYPPDLYRQVDPKETSEAVGHGHRRPVPSHGGYTKVTEETVYSVDPRSHAHHGAHGKEYHSQSSFYGGEGSDNTEYSGKSHVVDTKISYNHPSRATVVSKKLLRGEYEPLYRSSAESDNNDGANYGYESSDEYVSAGQGAGGHMRSTAYSGSEARGSYRSGYQSAQAGGSVSRNYYSDGPGYYGQDPSGYSSSEADVASAGEADEQGYGGYYNSANYYGKASSRGSVAQSYNAMEQGSAGGYRKSGVRSVVIRQAHGNTKKSSGYHHVAKLTSSRMDGSEAYRAERSATF